MMITTLSFCLYWVPKQEVVTSCLELKTRVPKRVASMCNVRELVAADGWLSLRELVLPIPHVAAVFVRRRSRIFVGMPQAMHLSLGAREGMAIVPGSAVGELRSHDERPL